MFFKSFAHLYLDNNHAYHQPLSLINEKNLVRILLYLRNLLMHFRLLKLSCIINGYVFLFLAVNGGWGSWGPWDRCTGSCGDTSRSRYRNCDNPAPLYGGYSCTVTNSSNVEVDRCHKSLCPGRLI